MKIKELIRKLEMFDPEDEILVFDGEPHPINFEIEDGETDLDHSLWVDTACDGPYTGTETKVAQISLVMHADSPK